MCVYASRMEEGNELDAVKGKGNEALILIGRGGETIQKRGHDCRCN